MQKNHRPPVGWPNGRNIHVGKAQILAPERYGHEMDGIGIRESFKCDAHRLGAGRSRDETNKHGHGDEQAMDECAA